jgi:hypothetical protein
MVEDQAIAQRMRKRARRMRFVNVVMRRVLGLPIRTPLSNRLMLLFYTGRRSGRSYRQPVSYATFDDALLTPGGGKWKLNLREGEPIAARVRGRKVRLIPTFVRAPDEVVRLLGVMYQQNRRLTSFVPFIGDDGRIVRGQLANALDRGFCIVRWHVERVGTTSTSTDNTVASHLADSIGGAQHDPPVTHDRAPGAAPSTARTDRRWLALAAVTAAGVVVTLDTTILNVAVPTIRRDLHTDLASLQQQRPRAGRWRPPSSSSAPVRPAPPRSHDAARPQLNMPLRNKMPATTSEPVRPRSDTQTQGHDERCLFLRLRCG